MKYEDENNGKKEEKVALVKSPNYNQKQIDQSLPKALHLSGIDLSEYSKKKVLLKPNIVNADVENPEATLTNNAILEGICKILKKYNCKIYIGESSFMKTHEFLKKQGIDKIAKKYSASTLIFEQDKLSKIKNPGGKKIQEFTVSKKLKEMELIINLPKLKTHQLTKITGAIKNFYGAIPGGMKQKLHKEGRNDEEFSKLLVDIYQGIVDFSGIDIVSVMDAVVGMEGNGPTSGSPKNSKHIIASKDPVVMDVVASKLMGFKPEKISTLKEAVSRGLGDFEYNLEGSQKIPDLKFKEPTGHKEGRFSRINEFLRRQSKKPIVVDKEKCIKCGLCSRKCPQEAITLNPYPEIDKKKCIRCFCCMEICPKHALSLKE